MVRPVLRWLAMDFTRPFTLSNYLAVLVGTCLILFVFDIIGVDFQRTALSELDLATHTASVASSSPLKQAFWLGLGALSGWMILRDPARMWQMGLALLPLLLLMGLALASISWALDPAIALRRTVLQVIVVTCVVTVVTYLRTPYQILAICYRVAALALLLNFVALILGTSFDAKGYFSGIYPQKNILGAVALVALVVGFGVRHCFAGQISRWLNSLFLLCWALMLVMSVSKTSISLAILIPAVIGITQFLARWLSLNFVLLLSCLGLAVLSLSQLVIWYHGLTVQGFLGLFMENTSLTGRDVIWRFLLERISEHWVAGHGFGSFWGIGFNSPNLRYGEGFITLLVQGHNGYLDLLAMLGFLGLMGFALVVANFAFQSSRVKPVHPELFFVCWSLLLMALVHNVSESSILRGFHLIWIVQLLAFALIARLQFEGSKEYR